MMMAQHQLHETSVNRALGSTVLLNFLHHQNKSRCIWQGELEAERRLEQLNNKQRLLALLLELKETLKPQAERRAERFGLDEPFLCCSCPHLPEDCLCLLCMDVCSQTVLVTFVDFKYNVFFFHLLISIGIRTYESEYFKLSTIAF